MKFIAEDDSLQVTLQGAEIFFGIKHRLTIPRSKILDLQWQSEYTNQRQLLRIGGAAIPGVLYSGYFRNKGHNFYLYIRRPQGPIFRRNFMAQNVLIITTKDYRYEQILLSCEPDIGAGLLNWWQGTSRPS